MYWGPVTSSRTLVSDHHRRAFYGAPDTGSQLYSDKGITMERTAKLVCFGRGGDSVEYGGGCHGSGYGTPENPHASAGCG